jgi:hypothetical protein
MSRTVLLEGGVAGAALGACVVVLAVLGLTPSLSWLPEVPLVGSAVLLPVAACGVAGWRAGSRSGHVLGGALAGAVAGSVGGGVGGVAYVLFGKPLLNVVIGLLLGALGGAVVGVAGAFLVGASRSGSEA